MKFTYKNEFKAEEHKITAEKCLAGRQETPAPIVIDLRSPDVYSADHLAGCNNLPADFLEDNLMQLPPFAPLMVYADSEEVMIKATQQLVDNGFDDVFWVDGGFAALIAALKADPNQVFLGQLPAEEWGEAIEKVLDEKVRPALASDGGGLTVNKIDGDKVYVNYEGACSGCASSTTGTLRFIQSQLSISLNHAVEVIPV